MNVQHCTHAFILAACLFAPGIMSSAQAGQMEEKNEVPRCGQLSTSINNPVYSGTNLLAGILAQKTGDATCAAEFFYRVANFQDKFGYAELVEKNSVEAAARPGLYAALSAGQYANAVYFAQKIVEAGKNTDHALIVLMADAAANNEQRKGLAYLNTVSEAGSGAMLRYRLKREEKSYPDRSFAQNLSNVLADFARNNPEDATFFANASVITNPHNDNIRYGLALGMNNAHQHALAKWHLEKISESSENYLAARLLLAKILVDDGESEKAIAMFENMVMQGKEDSFSMNMILGDLYDESGLSQKAIESFTQAISLSSENMKSYAYLRRADIFGKTGDNAAADSDFRAALEFMPQEPMEQPGILMPIAKQWVEQIRRLDDAMGLLETAFLLSHDNSKEEVLAILGTAYLRKGDFARAAGFIEKAIVSSKEIQQDVRIQENLGDAYWGANKQQDAAVTWAHTYRFLLRNNNRTPEESAVMKSLGDKLKSHGIDTETRLKIDLKTTHKPG